MTLPPVVSDLEVCPSGEPDDNGLILTGGPHGWKHRIHDDHGQRFWYQVCRHCGGRKPDTVDDWPPRDSND